MKSKYTQIIDADSDENNIGILKRAQERLVSDKDKNYDILVASREDETSIPRVMRGDQRGVAKNISSVITGSANVLNNNQRAQDILGKIADVTMSKKVRKITSEVVKYRKGKKDKPKNRK